MANQHMFASISPGSRCTTPRRFGTSAIGLGMRRLNGELFGWNAWMAMTRWCKCSPHKLQALFIQNAPAFAEAAHEQPTLCVFACSCFRSDMHACVCACVCVCVCVCACVCMQACMHFRAWVLTLVHRYMHICVCVCVRMCVCVRPACTNVCACVCVSPTECAYSMSLKSC
jgi:hypothetical protein